MSAFGRGRGFDVKDAPLRRPGQALSPTYNNVVNLISNLSINDISSGTNIDEIVKIINEAIKNITLKEVFDELHEHALNDRTFGIKLTLACCDPRVYSINDNSLRLILLQKLQSDYEEKDEIKKKSIHAFRNAISLFGEIYNNLKINGKPLDIFATPLLDYLNILLDTSEEPDVHIVTSQIYSNGRKIFEIIPAELEHFIMKVRLVLINRNVSAKSRGMLLFIVDFAAQNYMPLSGLIKEFYINDLNNKLLTDILSSDTNSIAETSISTSFSNNVQVETDNAQSQARPKIKLVQQSSTDIVVPKTMKSPPRQKSFSAFGANEKSLTNIANERPIPRAIRGAGALDSTKDRNAKKSPRGKKDKLTDEQIWSSKQNTNSKVWGHDDRFEKDY